MSNKSKGVRAKLKAQIPVMIEMHKRGLTWGQIGRKFGRQRSAVRKSVEKYLPVPHFDEVRKLARGLD